MPNSLLTLIGAAPAIESNIITSDVFGDAREQMAMGHGWACLGIHFLERVHDLRAHGIS